MPSLERCSRAAVLANHYRRLTFLAEGRAAILKIENNALRRKLYAQTKQTK